VRSPREISFRLRQELANLRMFVMPPTLTADQKPPLPGLPDPALVADRLRGSEFARTVEALAEEIVAHRFPLLAYEIDTGPEIDWQLDYVHGIRPDAQYFRLVPYLDFHKAGDHKVIWELNRHQHLVVLAQAFLLTGRAEFVSEIQRQLESWLAANPYLRGMNFTSALEVAFRALSWIWVYHLAGSAMTGAFRHRLLGAIYRHGAYLEHNLSVYFSPNTHLLGEGVALHAIGRLFPKFPNTRRWKRRGAEIVDEALDKQVRDDGTHFEQSTYYHVYALDLFLLHYILAGKIPRKLEKMAEYLHAVMGPERSLPFFGDDDGGRLFHPYGTRSDFGRATLATCAVLFERPDWDVEIHDLEEQAIWWLGDRPMPQQTDIARDLQLFEQAGIAVITEGDLHVVADAGPFSEGSGGHSHSDTLSFVMRLGREEILIDPGTYTYVAEPDLREWFRSSAAHNTIRIDGLNQATAVGPFRWMEHPETDVWKQKDGALEGVCRHHGFTHRRRILVQRQRMLVHDEVFGPKGVHVVEQLWHTGESAEQLAPNLFQIGVRTLLTVSGPATLEEGWRSRVLGHKEFAPVVRFKRESPFPVALTTEFTWK
jgi:hypothetical protein